MAISTNEIIVNAYPKSGITWLLHLICDLLEGQHQDDPGKECYTYNHPVTSNWIIRKKHFPYWSQAIPYLENRTIIFTQRDPRDVVVSAMYYRKTTDLLAAVNHMIHSNYIGWLNSWLEPAQPLRCNLLMTSYERLHNRTAAIRDLRYIIYKATGRTPSTPRIRLALERQSFSNMVEQMNGDRHFMRRGIVGDWRNHFDRETAKLFHIHFGKFMLKRGYIDDLDWWQDV